MHTFGGKRTIKLKRLSSSFGLPLAAARPHFVMPFLSSLVSPPGASSFSTFFLVLSVRMEVIESFLRKQGLVKKWADSVLGYELSSDDLWEQLKTGVDLCRLMLKLKEGYVYSIENLLILVTSFPLNHEKQCHVCTHIQLCLFHLYLTCFMFNLDLSLPFMKTQRYSL
jgi:hypothetical protein